MRESLSQEYWEIGRGPNCVKCHKWPREVADTQNKSTTNGPIWGPGGAPVLHSTDTPVQSVSHFGCNT